MRILIGSDLSGVSDVAVLQGAALLKAQGDELGLCHVLPAPQLRTLFPQEHERDLAALLELQPRFTAALHAQLERLFGSKSIPVSIFIEYGSDYSELVRRAEQWQADLLVVGSHGRAGLSRFLSPGVAERVVRHATCPVLVARERPKGVVLVATDLSDPSLPAIEAGAREAARRDRRLVVAHVTETLSWRSEPAMALLGVTPVTETPDIAQERATLARQIIEAAFDRFGAKGEAQIVDGDAAEEILKLVEKLPAELLVVGTRGRGSVSRVMLGSVAAHLVQSAPCSVLAVRLKDN
ncbi:MAG TPA: universal stress protein [Polyangiaceae bacterium]|jgi:nucleotide-binding universal stress UspA family protein|nr:universal stress protein [Polyangiaceae bacterium]